MVGGIEPPPGPFPERPEAVAPAHPVAFDVEYPDRDLDRVSTAFRLVTVIPAAVVLGSIGGASTTWGSGSYTFAVGGSGLLVVPPLLMLVFREKYPRWWFRFNLELMRFSARVGAYAALLSDVYPSTDERQYVRLELPEPASPPLNRWLPLVKWLLAVPHYLLLTVLWLGVLPAVVGAWFAILFTGRYPRGLFDFVVGVARWQVRVVAYAFVLVTDEYPPFGLRA